MIANIPCRGFGPSASIPFVCTRGYSIGAPLQVAVPDIVIDTVNFTWTRADTVGFSWTVTDTVDYDA